MKSATSHTECRGNTVSNTGKKNKLVSFTNGFHGRTMGALSLTWCVSYAFKRLLYAVQKAVYGRPRKPVQE